MTPKQLILAVLVLWLTCLTQTTYAEQSKKRSSHNKSKRMQVADSSKHKAPRSGAYENRFAKGTYVWGVSIGAGYTIDMPTTNAGAPDRTNMDFLYIFPHFKYNLTGPIGKSFYQGALYWNVELGGVVTVSDSDRIVPGGARVVTANSGLYQFGITPVQVEYKFVKPTRRWAPTVLAGAGFSIGDFNDGAVEISTDFEFILQAGAGIEYYLKEKGAVSLNYRLFHLSNSNIERPNIGINAHVFTLGYSF